jgi:hypothetical protein
VAYFDEGARYYGRYEGGLMCGVGIYCHPNGDRFEGMFFSNKPDGPGSFYERDHFTGNFTGSHAIWQAGRKVKDINFPFVPTPADLPDHDGKVRHLPLPVSSTSTWKYFLYMKRRGHLASIDIMFNQTLLPVCHCCVPSRRSAQEIFSEIMQYAGMSEDITADPSPTPGAKFGVGLLSASHSLTDLQQIGEGDEDDEDDEQADGAPRGGMEAGAGAGTKVTQNNLQAQLSGVQLKPAPRVVSPVPPSAPGTAQANKAASVIRSSILGSSDMPAKSVKRNFTYFDG